MNIFISDEKELNYIISSGSFDDSYNFEVHFKDNCLLVFTITNDGNIDTVFGRLQNYTITLDLLEKIISIAKKTLMQKQSEWLKSKERYGG